jgi:FtsP/CotA-like multicopper oxidase with cupredoxin domain
MQSEFYTTLRAAGSRFVEYSHQDGLDENPRYIVYNGGAAMLNDSALCASVGERVRILFGNAGPNKSSAFHVVGAVMDRVYRDGDLISPTARGLQTTLVPPGGAAVVEFVPQVPGMYTFLDHAIFRIQKGAMGMVHVEGPANPEVYNGLVTALGAHMSHH